MLYEWEGIPNDKAKMGAGLLPSYRSILSTNIDLFLWSNRRTLFFQKKLGARSKNWVIKIKMIFTIWKPAIRRLRLKVFLGFKSTVEKSG